MSFALQPELLLIYLLLIYLPLIENELPSSFEVINYCTFKFFAVTIVHHSRETSYYIMSHCFRLTFVSLLVYEGQLQFLFPTDEKQRSWGLNMEISAHNGAIRVCHWYKLLQQAATASSGTFSMEPRVYFNQTFTILYVILCVIWSENITHKPAVSGNVHIKRLNGGKKECDLSDFDRCMIVGARRAGMSIFITADRLGFSCWQFTHNGAIKKNGQTGLSRQK